ncbi:MAG: tripartite tricarboxylate transporter substrate binding protein [Betaproteobacteria bacterium]|nr:tripartite tricarboxylate transporter substrate binding protein [Betaproteobacteria bacterium]
MFFRALVVALLLVVAQAASAQAQYPSKPVRIVIPYPPGGGTDLQGRPMAQILTEKWGQNAVIDNRGGAAGMVGAEIVAKSKPDGYTVLMCASGEVALNVALYPKMAYDPEHDLTPVSLLSISPLVLVVHPSLPARNVREFIALAKKRPGEIAYASSGAGGPHHIAGEWMKLLAGINIIHVPYKGGGPQLADLIGGHVHSAFIALPVVAPHAKSAKIRVLAVTTAKRSQTLPDVPTLGESGLAGFDVAQWWGIMVPAGTPSEIVAKLNTDFVGLTRLPDIRARMATLGAEPVGSTAAQFAEVIRSDIAKYRKIVKDAKISIN